MGKYAAIRDALLQRITSGAWAPGAPIPHEAALAAEFGVTRPTISRALRGLVEQGLIERKRRAGSRVALRRSREAVLTIPIVRDAIEAEGRRYGYRLLERRLTPPPRAVGALFAAAGAPALHVLGLHLADGRPYQLEDRWINLRALPEAAEQDFARLSANEWLVTCVPYTRAEHVLHAAAALPWQARALAVPAGSPVFVIERRTWLGANAITKVRLVHPGPGFRMVSRDRL